MEEKKTEIYVTIDENISKEESVKMSGNKEFFIQKAKELMGQNKDFNIARLLLEPIADNGDPEAQYLLAYCFYKAPRSLLWLPEHVNEYLQKAARQGHAKAAAYTGLNYELGVEASILQIRTQPSTGIRFPPMQGILLVCIIWGLLMKTALVQP